MYVSLGNFIIYYTLRFPSLKSPTGPNFYFFTLVADIKKISQIVQEVKTNNIGSGT